MLLRSNQNRIRVCVGDLNRLGWRVAKIDIMAEIKDHCRTIVTQNGDLSTILSESSFQVLGKYLPGYKPDSSTGGTPGAPGSPPTPPPSMGGGAIAPGTPPLDPRNAGLVPGAADARVGDRLQHARNGRLHVVFRSPKRSKVGWDQDHCAQL